MTNNNIRNNNQLLEVLILSHCPQITGSFDDLYDFVSLKTLDIDGNPNISGDIRKVNISKTLDGDLPSIKQLRLGPGIYGGGDEFQSIQEAPTLMIALYNLMKYRSPTMFGENNNKNNRRWRLSKTSRDYYTSPVVHVSRRPPFYVEFFNFENIRIGWRWTNRVGSGSNNNAAAAAEKCEINWIDPTEPTVEKYGPEIVMRYRMALHEDRQKYIHLFHGLYHPPTEMEYKRRLSEMPLNKVTAKATIIPTNWGVW